MKAALYITAVAVFATIGCGKSNERLTSYQSQPESVRTCGYVDTHFQREQISDSDYASLMNKELKLVSAKVISSQKTGQNSYQEIAGSIKIAADDSAPEAEVLCSTAKSKSVTLNNEVEIAVPSTLVVSGDRVTESEASQVSLANASFSRTADTAEEPKVAVASGEGFKTLEGWVRSKKDARIRYYKPTANTLLVRVVTRTELSYKIEIYEFEVLPSAVATPSQTTETEQPPQNSGSPYAGSPSAPN